MEKNKYRYSVALSFSGEQRSYVEQVSNELTRLNVHHFYDFNEQENLWGKDLARYLDKLYYEDAEYFVPFISKEYVEKVWPNLELSTALDRNMKDLRPNFQQYILPVYFDNIRINGIPKSIGYYDANRVSPKELAKAIYRKIHPSENQPIISGFLERQADLVDRPSNVFCESQTKYIETINEIYVNQIFNICELIGSSRVIVVFGERGLGKRSCISRALSKIKNKSLYHIQPYYGNSYKYDSVIQSLNLDEYSLFSKHDLDFESNIKHKIISKLTEVPSVVYIEHFHKFDEESRRLLYELATLLITRYAQSDVCLIFEFDSDIAIDCVDNFYELPPDQTKLIEFSRLSSKEITTCFYGYCSGIKISEKNLTYIIRSSLGNIMYLNVIVNYLKGAGYICEIEGQLTCKHLPNSTLSDVLKKYLLQRYNRLDDVLKELLSKSSIVGNIFNAELLEMPFQIINAAEKLSNIEKISNLIERCNDRSYIFETEDVYNLIRSNIPNEQQKEWHKILAHYFQRILNREKKRKNALASDKTISLVYSIASHFKYANEYPSALPYYLQLITLYSKLCDYTNELKIIDDLHFILNRAEIDEKELYQIEIDITIHNADCLKGLGRYEEAYGLYNEAVQFVDDGEYSKALIGVCYNEGYCLYMMGKVAEAQEVLYSVCEKFELQNSHKKDYIRIISLLASICDSTNDISTKKKFYLESLTYYRENHCEVEYYELLKMASMVFDEEIAFKMEQEAENFFRNNQSVRNLAETLHNLATTELYLDRTEKINTHLNECITLFDTFGSKAVHYPLNTKGIFQMVVDQHYEEAISTFTSAISSSTENYSEITIRTNIIQCLIQQKKFDEAYRQIEHVDTLISEEPHGVVPVYETFSLLNRAFFFFHLNEYKKSGEYLKKLGNQSNIEDRHKYIVKSLRYAIRKKQFLKARNTAGNAPYPIYRCCTEKGFFFATLRFFE